MNYSGSMPDWHQYSPAQSVAPEASPVGQNVNPRPTFGSSVVPRTINGPNISPEGLNKPRNERNFSPRNFQQSPSTLNGPNGPENSPLAPMVQMPVGLYGTLSPRNSIMDNINSPLDPRSATVGTLNEATIQRNTQVQLNGNMGHLNSSNITGATGGINSSLGPMGQRNQPLSSMPSSRQGPGPYVPCKGPCCNPDANLAYQNYEKFGPYPPNISYRENLGSSSYSAENRRFNNDFSLRKDSFENKEPLGPAGFAIDPRRNFADYKYRKDSMISRGYAPPPGVLQNYPVQNYNFSGDYSKYPQYPIKDYSRENSMLNSQNPGILKYQEQSVIVQQKYSGKQVQYQNGAIPKGVIAPNVSNNMIARAHNPYFNPQLSRDFPRDYSEGNAVANRGMQTTNPIHPGYSTYQMYQQKIAMQRFSMETHLRDLTRIPGYQSHPKYQECLLRYRELLRLQQTVDYRSTVQDSARVVASQANDEIPPINLQFDQNGVLINSTYLPSGFPSLPTSINIQNPESTQNMNNSEARRPNSQQPEHTRRHENVLIHAQKQESRPLHPVALPHEKQINYSTPQDLRQGQYPVQRHESRSFDTLNRDASDTASIHQRDAKDFADKPELDVRQFLANWDESEDEDGANANLVEDPPDSTVVVVDYTNSRTFTENSGNADNVQQCVDDRSRENNQVESESTNPQSKQICSGNAQSASKDTECSDQNSDPSNLVKNAVRTGSVIQCTNAGTDATSSIRITENEGNLQGITQGTSKITETSNPEMTSKASDVIPNDENFVKTAAVEREETSSITEHLKSYDSEGNAQSDFASDITVLNCGGRSNFSKASSDSFSESLGSDISLSDSDANDYDESNSNSELDEPLGRIQATGIHVDMHDLSNLPVSHRNNSEITRNQNLQKQSSFASEESHNPDDISLPDLPTSEYTPISTTLNTPIHSDSEESSEEVIDLTIPTNPIEIIQNSPMLSFTHSPIKIEPYEHFDSDSLMEKSSCNSLNFDFQRRRSSSEYKKTNDMSPRTEADHDIACNEDNHDDSRCEVIRSSGTDSKKNSVDNYEAIRKDIDSISTTDDSTIESQFSANTGSCVSAGCGCENTTESGQHSLLSVVSTTHEQDISDEVTCIQPESSAENVEDSREVIGKSSEILQTGKIVFEGSENEMSNVRDSEEIGAHVQKTNENEISQCHIQDDNPSPGNATPDLLTNDETKSPKVNCMLKSSQMKVNEDVPSNSINNQVSYTSTGRGEMFRTSTEHQKLCPTSLEQSKSYRKSLENQENLSSPPNIMPLIPGEHFEEPKIPVPPMEGNCLTKIMKDTLPITDLDVLGSDEEKLEEMDNIWIDVRCMETTVKAADENMDADGTKGSSSKMNYLQKKLRMVQKSGLKHANNETSVKHDKESISTVSKISKEKSNSSSEIYENNSEEYREHKIDETTKVTIPIADSDVHRSGVKKSDQLDDMHTGCSETAVKETPERVEVDDESGFSPRESYLSKKLRKVKKSSWKHAQKITRGKHVKESVTKILKISNEKLISGSEICEEDYKECQEQKTDVKTISTNANTVEDEKKMLKYNFQSAINTENDNIGAILTEEPSKKYSPLIQENKSNNTALKDNKQDSIVHQESSAAEMNKCQEKGSHINDIATKLLENARLFEPELRRMEIIRKEPTSGVHSRDSSKERMKLLKEFRKLKDKPIASNQTNVETSIYPFKSFGNKENDSASTITKIVSESLKTVFANEHANAAQNQISTDISCSTASHLEMAKEADEKSESLIYHLDIKDMTRNDSGNSSITTANEHSVLQKKQEHVSIDVNNTSGTKKTQKETDSDSKNEDNVLKSPQTTTNPNEIVGNNFTEGVLTNESEIEVPQTGSACNSDEQSTLQMTSQVKCESIEEDDTNASSQTANLIPSALVNTRPNSKEPCYDSRGNTSSNETGMYNSNQSDSLKPIVVDEVNSVDTNIENDSAQSTDDKDVIKEDQTNYQATKEEPNKYEDTAESRNVCASIKSCDGTIDTSAPNGAMDNIKDTSAEPKDNLENQINSENSFTPGSSITEKCNKSPSNNRIIEGYSEIHALNANPLITFVPKTDNDKRENDQGEHSQISCEPVKNTEESPICSDFINIEATTVTKLTDSHEESESRAENLENDQPVEQAPSGERENDEILSRISEFTKSRKVTESSRKMESGVVLSTTEKHVDEQSSISVIDENCTKRLDMVENVIKPSEDSRSVTTLPEKVNNRESSPSMQSLEPHSFEDTTIAEENVQNENSDGVASGQTSLKDVSVKASSLETSFNFDFGNFDVPFNESSTAESNQIDSWKYSKAHSRFEDCERYKNPDSYVNPIPINFDSLDNLNTVPVYTTKDGKITYSPNPRFTYRALVMEARKREGYPSMFESYYVDPKVDSEPNCYAKVQNTHGKRKYDEVHSNANTGSDNVGCNDGFSESRIRKELLPKYRIDSRHNDNLDSNKVYQQTKDRTPDNFPKYKCNSEKSFNTEITAEGKEFDRCNAREEYIAFEECNIREDSIAEFRYHESKLLEETEELTHCYPGKTENKCNMTNDPSNSEILTDRLNVSTVHVSRNSSWEDSSSPDSFSDRESHFKRSITRDMSTHLELSTCDNKDGAADQDTPPVTTVELESIDSKPLDLSLGDGALEKDLFNVLEEKRTNYGNMSARRLSSVWDDTDNYENIMSRHKTCTEITVPDKLPDGQLEDMHIDHMRPRINSFSSGNHSNTSSSNVNIEKSSSIEIEIDTPDTKESEIMKTNAEKKGYDMKECIIQEQEPVADESRVPHPITLSTSQDLDKDSKVIDVETPGKSSTTKSCKIEDNDCCNNLQGKFIDDRANTNITDKFIPESKETDSRKSVSAAKKEIDPSILNISNEHSGVLYEASVENEDETVLEEQESGANNGNQVASEKEISCTQSRMRYDNYKEPKVNDNDDSLTGFSNSQTMCESSGKVERLYEDGELSEKHSSNSQQQGHGERRKTESHLEDYVKLQRKGEYPEQLTSAADFVEDKNRQYQSDLYSVVQENLKSVDDSLEKCIAGRDHTDELPEREPARVDTSPNLKSQCEKYTAYPPSDESTNDHKIIPKLVIKRTDVSSSTNTSPILKVKLPLDLNVENSMDEIETRSKVPTHPKIPKIIIRNARSRPSTPSIEEIQEEIKSSKNSKEEHKTLIVKIRLEEKVSNRGVTSAQEIALNADEVANKIPKIKIKLEDKLPKVIVKDSNRDNLKKSKNLPKAVRKKKAKKIESTSRKIAELQILPDSAPKVLVMKKSDTIAEANIGSETHDQLRRHDDGIKSSDSERCAGNVMEADELLTTLMEDRREKIPKLKIKRHASSSSTSSTRKSQNSSPLEIEMKKAKISVEGDEFNDKKQYHKLKIASKCLDDIKNGDKYSSLEQSDESTAIKSEVSDASKCDIKFKAGKTLTSKSASEKVPKVIIKRTSPSAEFKCELSKGRTEAIIKNKKWQPVVKLQRSWVLDRMAKELRLDKLTLKLATPNSTAKQSTWHTRPGPKRSYSKRSISKVNHRPNQITRSNSTSDLLPIHNKSRWSSGSDTMKLKSNYAESMPTKLIADNRRKSDLGQTDFTCSNNSKNITKLRYIDNSDATQYGLKPTEQLENANVSFPESRDKMNDALTSKIRLSEEQLTFYKSYQEMQAVKRSCTEQPFIQYSEEKSNLVEQSEVSDQVVNSCKNVDENMNSKNNIRMESVNKFDDLMINPGGPEVVVITFPDHSLVSHETIIETSLPDNESHNNSVSEDDHIPVNGEDFGASVSHPNMETYTDVDDDNSAFISKTTCEKLDMCLDQRNSEYYYADKKNTDDFGEELEPERTMEVMDKSAYLIEDTRDSVEQKNAINSSIVSNTYIEVFDHVETVIDNNPIISREIDATIPFVEDQNTITSRSSDENEANINIVNENVKDNVIQKSDDPVVEYSVSKVTVNGNESTCFADHNCENVTEENVIDIEKVVPGTLIVDESNGLNGSGANVLIVSNDKTITVTDVTTSLDNSHYNYDNSLIKVNSLDESQSKLEILQPLPDISQSEVEIDSLSEATDETSIRLYPEDTIPTQFELELEIIENIGSDPLEVPMPGAPADIEEMESHDKDNELVFGRTHTKFDCSISESGKNSNLEAVQTKIVISDGTPLSSSTLCKQGNHYSSRKKSSTSRKSKCWPACSDAVNRISVRNSDFIQKVEHRMSNNHATTTPDKQLSSNIAKSFYCSDLLVKEVLAAKEALRKCLAKSKNNDKLKCRTKPKTAAEKKQGSSFDLSSLSSTDTNLSRSKNSYTNNSSSSQDSLKRKKQGCHNGNNVEKCTNNQTKTESKINTQKSEKKHSKNNKSNSVGKRSTSNSFTKFEECLAQLEERTTLKHGLMNTREVELTQNEVTISLKNSKRSVRTPFNCNTSKSIPEITNSKDTQCRTELLRPGIETESVGRDKHSYSKMTSASSTLKAVLGQFQGKSLYSTKEYEHSIEETICDAEKYKYKTSKRSLDERDANWLTDTSKMKSYKIPKISKLKNPANDGLRENTSQMGVKEDKMPVLEPQINLSEVKVFDSNTSCEASRSPPIITNQEIETDQREAPETLEDTECQAVVAKDQMPEKTVESVLHKKDITVADIVNELAYHEKATIKHRRYCTLCERWFPTVAKYRRHLTGYQHRHTELTQRRTVHALFTLFTGTSCPRLQPASVVRTDCTPGELTPLQIAVQDITKGLNDVDVTVTAQATEDK